MVKAQDISGKGVFLVAKRREEPPPMDIDSFPDRQIINEHGQWKWFGDQR